MILFSHLKPQYFVQLVYRTTIPFTAKRILERLGIQTSSSFVCIPEFKTNFLFICLFFFYLESIGVRLIMIWWLAFEKKTFQFWQEIWIQVLVIHLQLYYVHSYEKTHGQKQNIICSKIEEISILIEWNSCSSLKYGL